MIDVLQGSNTEKIRQFEHDKLSTFGIGQTLDINQWRSVFRQLVARGYLSVDLERYGALRLEQKCRPLLKGEQQIELRRDSGKKAVARQTKTPLPEDINVGLWEALRECRRLFAEAQGVPPYVIFHDKTLREMAEQMPQNTSEFGLLTGVGERKLEKYSEAFLAVIQEAL